MDENKSAIFVRQGQLSYNFLVWTGLCEHLGVLTRTAPAFICFRREASNRPLDCSESLRWTDTTSLVARSSVKFKRGIPSFLISEPGRAQPTTSIPNTRAIRAIFFPWRGEADPSSPEGLHVAYSVGSKLFGGCDSPESFGVSDVFSFYNP